MYKIFITERVAQKGNRNSVGGFPILAKHQVHPRCKICDARMVLFLQFYLKPEFELSLLVNSHFLAFMCPNHNDAALMSQNFIDREAVISNRYWEQEEGHFALIINPPNIEEIIGECDPFIQPKQLDFVKAEETIEDWGDPDSGISLLVGSEQGLKIGGTPSWFNYACQANCSCGSKMQFICQIPTDFGFAQIPDAPKQPDGFSSTEYCFLLGNQVYIMACGNHCHERAAIAICDN
jgi:hypothetical protein